MFGNIGKNNLFIVNFNNSFFSGAAIYRVECIYVYIFMLQLVFPSILIFYLEEG